MFNFFLYICFCCFYNIFFMLLFALFLTYEGDDNPRKIADGCSNSQLFEILNRHIMLSEVANFQIVPFEYYVPFKEYTL